MADDHAKDAIGGMTLGPAALSTVGAACADEMMEDAASGLIVVTTVLLPTLGSAEEASVGAAAEADAESVPEMTEGDSVALGGRAAEADALAEDPEEGGSGAPVRAREARSSGMVSMNAMVGPATTLLVAWSRMLFANGCESDVT